MWLLSSAKDPFGHLRFFWLFGCFFI
jgi:hypothetical protein